MGSPEDRERHARRRKNHIAKDLRTKKYEPRVIPVKTDKMPKLDIRNISKEIENDE